MTWAHTLVAVLTLATACHRSKEVVEAAPPPPPVEEAQALENAPIITGTLSSAHAAEGCAWLVLVDHASSHPDGVDQGIPEMLIPIALEEQYLKDGLRLRFTYRLSRAHNGGCTQGTPAILENIVVLPQKSATPAGVNAPVDR